MPITSADIIFRAPAEVSDAGTNGGRVTNTTIAAATKNNVFPDVRSAERASGSTKHRKVFVHPASADNSVAYDVRIIPWAPTQADDHCLIRAGTLTENQAAFLAANRRPYGVATVTSGATAGSTSISATAEGSSDIFQAGDIVFVTNKATPSSTGSEEFATVASATRSGNNWTITLQSPGLAATHTGTVRIASCLQAGDLAAGIANTAKTGAGSIDFTAITVPARSLHAETVTITFSSATNFSATGSVSGSLGSGTTGATFAPNDPATGAPRFSIPATAWSGTWASGNTVTFDLAPQMTAIWMTRIVPAGCAPFTANSFQVVVDLESG